MMNLKKTEIAKLLAQAEGALNNYEARQSLARYVRECTRQKLSVATELVAKVKAWRKGGLRKNSTRSMTDTNAKRESYAFEVFRLQQGGMRFKGDAIEKVAKANKVSFSTVRKACSDFDAEESKERFLKRYYENVPVARVFKSLPSAHLDLELKRFFADIDILKKQTRNDILLIEKNVKEPSKKVKIFTFVEVLKYLKLTLNEASNQLGLPVEELKKMEGAEILKRRYLTWEIERLNRALTNVKNNKDAKNLHFS